MDTSIADVAKHVGFVALGVMFFSATVEAASEGRAVASAIWGAFSGVYLIAAAIVVAAYIDLV